MTAWRLLAAGLAYPDVAIRRRRLPSPAARWHLRTAPCVSTTVPVDSQVAADFVRRSLAGMYLGDSHCALRVWVQRRCGSTSRQLDPDRFGGQTRRDLSHEYPASSGMWRLPAASGCMGLPATRTAPDHVTRGRRLSRWWWQVLGSNQRRLSRRFYRPFPLATRATCRMPQRWRHRKDSRRRDRAVSGIRLSG